MQNFKKSICAKGVENDQNRSISYGLDDIRKKLKTKFLAKFEKMHFSQ